MKHRIRPDYLDTRPVHEEAVIWVDQLILDLKLQLLGEQPAHPIDMTRLEQWAGTRTISTSARKGYGGIDDNPSSIYPRDVAPEQPVNDDSQVPRQGWQPCAGDYHEVPSFPLGVEIGRRRRRPCQDAPRGYAAS